MNRTTKQMYELSARIGRTAIDTAQTWRRTLMKDLFKVYNTTLVKHYFWILPRSSSATIGYLV